MSDLTDERIAELVNRGSNGRNHDERAVHTSLLELQLHRAAVAADRERIRTTVSSLMIELIDSDGPVTTRDEVGYIAERAADQLATAAVRLTADERDALRKIRLAGPQHERQLARDAIDRLLGRP